MAYPLIIFGAGASYDYSTECKENKLSPLTNSLVEPTYLLPELLRKYEGVGNLLADIIPDVRDKNISFEDALTKKRNESKSEGTKRQIIALEFFLRDLFTTISDPNHPWPKIGIELRQRLQSINNYRKILNRIDEFCEGKACIVTFNYDSLFESSLPLKVQPLSIKDYTSKEIKIIKVHGSHDWSYIQRKSVIFGPNKDLDAFEYSQNEQSFSHKDHGLIYYNELPQKELQDFNTYPAIAIPLSEKDQFICPDFHIKALEKEIQLIDRILIIGWKAADPLFLEILNKKLPKKEIEVTIVSGTSKDASDVASILKDKLDIKTPIHTSTSGFSEFLANGEDKIFFARSTNLDRC